MSDYRREGRDGDASKVEGAYNEHGFTTRVSDEDSLGFDSVIDWRSDFLNESDPYLRRLENKRTEN